MAPQRRGLNAGPLNTSLSASKEMMSNLLANNRDELTSDIKGEIESIILKLNQTAIILKNAAKFNLVASLLALVASGVVVLGLFFR